MPKSDKYLRGVATREMVSFLVAYASEKNISLADVHQILSDDFANYIETKNGSERFACFRLVPKNLGIIDLRPNAKTVDKCKLNASLSGVSIRAWVYNAIAYFVESKTE